MPEMRAMDARNRRSDRRRKLRSRGIGDIAEANDVLAAMKTDEAATVIIQSSPFMYRHRERIINSATNHGLATIYAFPPAARDGALIAYGPDYVDLYRRAASYVERILEQLPRDDPAVVIVGMVDQPSSLPELVNRDRLDVLLADVPTEQLLAEHSARHGRTRTSTVPR
jgi:ABC-type uncharacterized transport system substrate-binding protein